MNGRASEQMERIENANREAVRRMIDADPVLVDVVPASQAISALGRHTILHAGPPVDWAGMCGPMQGAVCGIAVFEGWAPDLESAEAMAAAGAFDFQPNHHFDAVGPMTGVTTMSQPVLVIENKSFGNRACCTINEGLGKVMRFGGNDAEVVARLAWLRDVLGPAMGRALRELGGIELKAVIARGLSMGDGNAASLARLDTLQFYVTLQITAPIGLILELEAEDIVLLPLEELKSLLEATGTEEIGDHQDHTPLRVPLGQGARGPFQIGVLAGGFRRLQGPQNLKGLAPPEGGTDD